MVIRAPRFLLAQLKCVKQRKTKSSVKPVEPRKSSSDTDQAVVQNGQGVRADRRVTDQGGPNRITRTRGFAQAGTQQMRGGPNRNAKYVRDFAQDPTSFVARLLVVRLGK